jgi:hypothetical protein
VDEFRVGVTITVRSSSTRLLVLRWLLDWMIELYSSTPDGVTIRVDVEPEDPAHN